MEHGDGSGWNEEPSPCSISPGICYNRSGCTGPEDAAEELRRMEEAEAARREQEKLAGKTKDSQKTFKAV